MFRMIHVQYQNKLAGKRVHPDMETQAIMWGMDKVWLKAQRKYFKLLDLILPCSMLCAVVCVSKKMNINTY